MEEGPTLLHLTEHAERDKEQMGRHRQPLAGDWNAGLCEGDRKAQPPHKTPSTHCLYNRKDLCTWKQRRAQGGTYLPLITRGTTETVSSCIDDILMSKKNPARHK
jgi:hypothetical protein